MMRSTVGLVLRRRCVDGATMLAMYPCRPSTTDAPSSTNVRRMTAPSLLASNGAAAPSSFTTTSLWTSRAGFLTATTPLLQGLPIVKQADAVPDETLFARAGYSLFVLAYVAAHAESNTPEAMSLYCATTNRLLTLAVPSSDKADDKPLLPSAIAFIEANVEVAKFAAGIVFPEDASPRLAEFLLALRRESEQRRVVIGPDAWSIVFASFRAQQEHVKALTLPTGFEHASTLMTNKRFVPLSTPEAFAASVSSGGGGSAAALLTAAPLTFEDLTNAPTAARRGMVVWDALLNVHKRFGAVGSRKQLNPIDLVVRRAVKAVNIFGIDLDNRLGRGSVVEGITMVATIYNAQAGTNTVHQIRNLTEETVKLNVLTSLLYGEGTSSMTVLIPTARTKETQLAMFARICKPKCPFFIIQPSALGPMFNKTPPDFNFPDVHDPKMVFQKTIAACVPGVLKKDEATEAKRIIQAYTHLGQKLFDARVGNTLKSFSAGTKMPNPANALDDFSLQLAAAAPRGTPKQATSTPTADSQPKTSTTMDSSSVSAAIADATSPATLSGQGSNNAAPFAAAQQPTKQVFLNAVGRDPSVAVALQEWRDRIYNNPERLEREKAALATISKYLIVDLETTTKKRYKRIANPFTKDNYVVMSGALDYEGNYFLSESYFSRELSQAYADPQHPAWTAERGGRSVQGASPKSLFFPPLDKYDVLVGHNFKFDMLHLWNDQELKAFLHRGGKIWDTMYGEYLLTGHQVKLGRGAGLEDVAKSYGGQIPKLDLVKQAWATGKQTYEIPYATLREYLIGDLKNTQLIFTKHRERALEQRQVIICNARMDSLLATTEMEFNGLKIDVPLAIKQSNELVGQAVKMRYELDSCIPVEIPPKLRKFYNWASNSMLIPYFFGGKVKLNTGNRASKPPTGEKHTRHLIFSDASQFPASEYPDGVFIASTQNAMAAGDCVAMTTFGEAEKGTRVYVTCLDAYMKQCGFRKSSTLGDALSKVVVPVSRETNLPVGEADAAANLLPERTVFLFSAAEADKTSGKLSRLVFVHSETGDVKTFNCDPSTISASDLASSIESYFRDVVVSSTKALLAHDDSIDPSMRPDAFVTAQLIIVARDAPFTFRSLIESHSPEMQAMLTRRTDDVVNQRSIATAVDGETPQATAAIVPSVGTANRFELKEKFAVSLADATNAFMHYNVEHSEATYAAYDGKLPPIDPLLVIQPEWIPEKKGKAKRSVVALLQAEATEDPEVWCQRYISMFKHIARRTLELEGAKPLEAKKIRKNSPPPKDDEKLPMLLRRRPNMIDAFHKLDAARQVRLSLMILFGRLVGSTFDAIVEPSPFDDVVEIPLKGKLAQYFGMDSSPEMDAITKKFRSPVTRQLQVGDASLEYFAKTHKDTAASTIMELRGMEKLIGTYYEHTEGGTGMVSLTHSIDSCIHHELVHNKTNTGRLASANPNCQNIPKEDKSPLREMFVSRFAPHGKCIEVDYSQLEVITLAALSNDRQMIQDLENNVDFHCKRVTMIRPDLSYAEVVQRAKKDKEPPFVKLRQQAKIFSFQRQYGAGVAMLSESTGLSPDQVRQLIDAEKEIYKGCDQFTNVVTLSANNYDGSLQDGARNIRGHQVYKGMFPVLTGSRYVFTESDMPEAMLRDKPASTKSTNFSPTHIKNYPVQGFAGEIVQIMLGRLWRHFVANKNYGGRALLTNTVHDCVWVDATEEVFVEVSKDVDRILSSAQEELNRLFPEMKCGVRFGVDVVAGDNMCHLRPIPQPKK